MSEELFSGECNGECGSCGSDCDPTHSTVTLTLDNDTEVNCDVITIFPVQDKEYIALLPLDENGENEDGEVFLYRFAKDEHGNPQLDNIEDDDEYAIAAEAFDEWLDTVEFDEIQNKLDEEVEASEE